MKPAARPPSSLGAGKNWLLLCGGGVLVVVTGFAVPYLVIGRVGPLLNLSAKESPVALTPTPATELSPPDDWPAPRDMLLRLAGGTIAVLGLGVATLFLCRGWLQSRAATAGEVKREFELIETLHLGNHCRVHLVRAGGQHLLTGTDATGVKAVTALVDLEEELLGPDWGEEPKPLAAKLRAWSATGRVPSIDPLNING